MNMNKRRISSNSKRSSGSISCCLLRMCNDGCSNVDGVRVSYPEGWFLCRPSNTEPILVMRAEANDEEGLVKIKQDVEERLGEIINLEKFHNA